jgi:hypothetical protein
MLPEPGSFAPSRLFPWGKVPDPDARVTVVGSGPPKQPPASYGRPAARRRVRTQRTEDGGGRHPTFILVAHESPPVRFVVEQ